METNHPTKLTSVELSQLWANYQNDTMAVCIFQHFLRTVEDPDIASLLEKIMQYPKSHIPQLQSFFQGENWPVPQGFTEADVNLEAPRLYSDSFMLYYQHFIGIAAMNFFGEAFGVSTRKDVRQYFAACVRQATECNEMTTQLLLEKGLYIRSPYLSPPESIDFVTDRNFLGGWLGENRSLVSTEIMNLFANIQRNALGKVLLIGFSQVAGTEQIRKFMVRGKEMSEKQVNLLGAKLKKDDLPVSIPWDMSVTKSTEAPFSEKLMMFHTTALIGISIAYYGMSIGTSLRKDLTADFLRISGEVMKYAADGARIMIDKGWMEEPPQAANRDQLARQGEKG